MTWDRSQLGFLRPVALPTGVSTITITQFPGQIGFDDTTKMIDLAKGATD